MKLILIKMAHKSALFGVVFGGFDLAKGLNISAVARAGNAASPCRVRAAALPVMVVKPCCLDHAGIAIWQAVVGPIVKLEKILTRCFL
ncbi:MAG: hypothetical protein KDH97_01925 [Calditrichaeota bacterium]|nr:hypothetical protein [Calditrichota bacterium]MCB0288991.1 hypothetical protein [Calditrichota bacterium]MCB0295135.1 hypothetical protein [Calditrichota bacterium]MCB9090551.1 hypothetical protein [Calditrichia bacterium]